MFNLQGSELMIILLLALVVLGPEKLPEAMRKLGNFYAQMKKMSSSFQDEFKSAIDEPMREVRDTANMLRDSADFRKLASGDRAEKPKSADMPVALPPEMSADMVAPAKPSEPTTNVPFSGVSSASPRVQPAPDGASDAAAVTPGASGGLREAPPIIAAPKPPAGPVVSGTPPVSPAAAAPPPPPPPPNSAPAAPTEVGSE